MVVQVIYDPGIYCTAVPPHNAGAAEGLKMWAGAEGHLNEVAFASMATKNNRGVHLVPIYLAAKKGTAF